MKRAKGWELSFVFFFKRAFFYWWGGEEGGNPFPFQRDFFSCPFGKEMERCFFSSAGTFSMRGCLLIDMREGRGLVVSKCKG
jgi:hypothetical protein